LAAVVTLVVVVYGARAGTSQNEQVHAELVADVQSIQPGNPFWVAVRFEIEQDWHINWINPGDAGLAPSIEWNLPDGFKAGALLWPAPSRYKIGPLVIYGYDDELLLMARLLPPTDLQPGKRVEIGAAVDWLACAEACVPGEAKVRVRLPVNSSYPLPNDKWRAAMDKVRFEHPMPSGGWSVHAFVEDDERYVIEVSSRGENTATVHSCSFFPLEPDVIESASPQAFTVRHRGFEINLKRAHMSTEIPERLTGVLVSDTGFTRSDGAAKWRAISIDVPLETR
jgi:DsbC/DsbD-like thiol-disulfide interchange protein